jgi:membrane protein
VFVLVELGVGPAASPLVAIGPTVALFSLLVAGYLLPDVRLGWRDVWPGALASGVLFVAGELAIGWVLGRRSPGSAYGAAGALAVVLLWVYLSALLLLAGAELTQVLVRRRGRTVEPRPGAVRVGPEPPASAG